MSLWKQVTEEVFLYQQLARIGLFIHDQLPLHFFDVWTAMARQGKSVLVAVLEQHHDSSADVLQAISCPVQVNEGELISCQSDASIVTFARELKDIEFLLGRNALSQRGVSVDSCFLSQLRQVSSYHCS